MTPTSYGYKVPDDGDRSKGVSGWFAFLVYNWNRMSGHNHDGANSPQLAVSAVSGYTSTLSSASWTVSGSGYKQTVTVPAGITEINNFHVQFYINTGGSTGTRLYLTYIRLTATTFDVYCNDNTVDVIAVYR